MCFPETMVFTIKQRVFSKVSSNCRINSLVAILLKNVETHKSHWRIIMAIVGTKRRY